RPLLLVVVPVAALYFVFSGATSISVFLLQRRLVFSRFNIFEILVEVVSAAAHILFAIFSPTVWALVFGGLAAVMSRMIGSYFLLSDVSIKLVIYKKYAWQIFTFGKWIFISSMVYFISMSFDRLYLGKVASLSVLGVYGIARGLSDPIGA